MPKRTEPSDRSELVLSEPRSWPSRARAGLRWGTAIGGALFFVLALAVESVDAREREPVSRESASRESSQSDRKAIPRSPDSGGSDRVATAPRGRARTPKVGRSDSRGYDRSYRRHGRHHYGGRYGGYYGGGYYGFGYYGYSPYYLMYHRGYGPYYGYPGPYGYSRRYSGAVRPLGAVDLNIKPKKAEVYLDGERIGTAGEYDGFPGYLWLEEGHHQLIFRREGFETIVREVKVISDVVIDVRERLPEGIAMSPEEFPAPPEGAKRVVATAPERRVPSASVEPSEPVMELDATSDPGRLKLRVEPGDASVYLDGRFLGTGDDLSRLQAGVMVDPGSHTLEIVRPGYTTETLDFEVDSDAQAELIVELQPNVA